MTYDPSNLNRNRRLVRESEGMSGAVMAGIAIPAVLALGVLIYAFSGSDRMASDTPSTTTGQTQTAPTPSDPAPAQPKTK